jgi:hypothetical protein
MISIVYRPLMNPITSAISCSVALMDWDSGEVEG